MYLVRNNFVQIMIFMLAMTKSFKNVRCITICNIVDSNFIFAGFKSDILLIHPSQLVMYARIDAHRERINSLLFHPEQPTHLFSKFGVLHNFLFSHVSDDC